MSQHADEELDQDLLLEFSTEPDHTPTAIPDSAEPVQPAANVEVAATEPTPPASLELIESLNARVDRLEQTLNGSASQIAALKSVVATLVSTIDDIKKINRPSTKPFPPAAVLVSKPRRPTGSAIAGAVLGIAIGVWGWTAWSSDSVDAIEPAPVTVQQPTATEAPSQPAITFTSTTTSAPAPPTPARDAPTRSTPASVRAVTPRIDYVGTLSIDAAPGGEVFINRKPAGRTPLRVSNLKAGSHLVWIERDGYRRFTRVVHVPADQVSRLWADLEPIPAR